MTVFLPERIRRLHAQWNLRVRMRRKMIIYRRTGTASTYLMHSFCGGYATTPIDSIDMNLPCFNTEYEKVVQHLIANIDDRFLIINLVRNPLTRFPSQFFKNIQNEEFKSPVDGEMMPCPFYLGEDQSFEHLEQVFRSSIDTFLIPHDFGIEDSYPRLFGTTITDQPFDYQKKHLYFETGRFGLLTIRSEDSDEWPRIFRDVFGINHHFYRQAINTGSDTTYANLYKSFKERFRYTDAEKAKIQELQTYRRYYADDKV